VGEHLSASQRQIKALQAELNFYQVAFAAAIVELGGKFTMTAAKYDATPATILRRVNEAGVDFEVIQPKAGEVQ